MSDSERLLPDRLNAAGLFPAHGRATDESGATVLGFPLIRAVWERAPFGQATPSTEAPLKLRDYLGAGYLQPHFWKVVTLLEYIARDEATIIKDVREGDAPDQFVPFINAQETLPMWLDLFFVYFRILSNRFCVALGRLASKQPGSWPTNFRKLIEADQADLQRWKAAEPGPLFEALRSNRQWFDLLTSKGHEGVRDAIVHTLADPRVVVKAEGDGSRSVTVWRETPTGYEERDLLALVPQVVAGFCLMLSSLPENLWREERFECRDLVGSEGTWLAVDRFFPPIGTDTHARGD